jgi:AraC-like DNA-binding protein
MHDEEQATGTVSAGYAKGVLDFAMHCGVPSQDLLRAARFDERSFETLENRLPLATLRALFDSASTLLGDPAFALRFGVGVPCAQLTLASALAAARPEAAAGPSAAANSAPSLTLRDALDGLNRYATLALDFGARTPALRYRFVEESDGVWLEDQRPATGVYHWPALTESVFARFSTGIRRRGGESIVRALQVTHDAPVERVHVDAYDMVFRAPVTFGARRNALCLDPTFLARPLEPLAAPVQDATWSRRVTDVLRVVLPRDASDSGLSALGVVCRTLAVSRQTLHRHLRGEGTTFARLHDEVRREVADALLRRGELTVDAVAARVGFSESAAFSRAYKRWTGRRPSEVSRPRRV